MTVGESTIRQTVVNETTLGKMAVSESTLTLNEINVVIITLFSLRTSETNYLNEAFSFYAAIRGRAYYSRAVREDRYEFNRSVHHRKDQATTKGFSGKKISLVFLL